MTADATALFLGGHPALDFLNTTFAPHDETVEVIGDGPAFVRWLVRAGHLDEAAAAKLERRFTARAVDTAAAEARKLRGWAGRWVERWTAAPSGDYGAEWRRLNTLLTRASGYAEAVPAPEGWKLIERSHLAAPEEIGALVALPVARLISSEQPALVRRCAGPSCTLWFLDRTKAHRRVFCSAAACGNRAKVAAFRQRQRD